MDIGGCHQQTAEPRWTETDAATPPPFFPSFVVVLLSPSCCLCFFFTLCIHIFTFLALCRLPANALIMSHDPPWLTTNWRLHEMRVESSSEIRNFYINRLSMLRLSCVAKKKSAAFEFLIDFNQSSRNHRGRKKKCQLSWEWLCNILEHPRLTFRTIFSFFMSKLNMDLVL